MSGKKNAWPFGVAVTAVAMCVLTSWCVETAAEEASRPGGGFARNAKVWEAQAKTIAASLALSAEQTTKLVDAYKTARDNHTTATEAVAMPAERPDFQKLREINEAERDKFESALKKFLNPEQIEKALVTLGSFFRRWDGMVEALDAMDLADDPRKEAMKLTADYVAEWNKAMQVAMVSGNRESMREQANKLKEKLDTDMARVLSSEQMAKWTNATAKGGRRHR